VIWFLSWFFASTQLGAFFFWLAVVQFSWPLLFLFFVLASWWFSRPHNFRVGSKLRLEKSGLVQKSVLGGVILFVVVFFFWYRLSVAWWSVALFILLLLCLIPSLLVLSFLLGLLFGFLFFDNFCI